MAEAFLGEIRLFAGNYAPKGWALCNGQTMPISQSTALYSLLGTAYGGNGTTNFGLPNLQGNVPVNQGQGTNLSNYNLGQTGGEVEHTLISQELPAHTHTMYGSSASANLGQAASNYYGSGSRLVTLYGDSGSPTPMAGGVVGTNSGGGAHPNQQAYQVLTYIICLSGEYPSRP